MKKKVAYLISNLGIGGVQRVVLDIVSSIDTSQYEVAIFSLAPDKEALEQYKLPKDLKINFYSIEELDNFSLFGYFKASIDKSKYYKSHKKVIDDLIAFAPDIIHSHAHLKDLLLGVLVKKKIKCELVFTLHVSNFPNRSKGLRLLAFILRPLYKKYHLISVSKEIEKEVVSFKLLGRNKIHRQIENRINLNNYNPQPKIDDGVVRFVYVARIGHPKAHEDLIRAWALLNNYPVKKELLLVGPNLMGDYISNMVDQLINDNSVVFMGSQNNVATILQKVDIGVFPSHQEGLPIALLEKMAMKLPVIISDIPELIAVVDDQVNGLSFKCGNPQDLAEKMIDLIKNANKRIELGENARKKVETMYGSSNLAYANEVLYKLILS